MKKSPAVSQTSTKSLSSALEKKSLNAEKLGITKNKIHRHALQVVEKLQGNGFEAYIVGGCLRDLLLNKTPKDFDVATNARPDQIKHLFQRQCRLVGRRFHLAHILFGRDFIEVATFRGEHSQNSSSQHSRRSEEGMLLRDNVYGNMNQDAIRRDFTINAFYYDPATNRLYDFFDGLNDLKTGKLRLIGEPVKRYQEDPVRILRAIRFMAKLDMFLEEHTQKAIAQHLPLLANIPPARLYDESLKLLQSGNGFKTYQLLRKFGAFELLFPILNPFFTLNGDNHTEKMMVKVLQATDERIADNLSINPAFMFASFLWYPLRERMEILKNEGGLNNHDAYNLASSEILNLFCQRLSAPRRHTGVIRDIWGLQLQFGKRHGIYPQTTFSHPKFRAGYDLLAMRAEIEGGESIELLAWWHEYQQSNQQQRQALVNKSPKPKRKFYRRNQRRRKPNS